MKMSVQTLKLAGACRKQVTLFLSRFGNEPVEITHELCMQHAIEFDWAWGISTFFPPVYEERFHEEVYSLGSKIRVAVRNAISFAKLAGERQHAMVATPYPTPYLTPYPTGTLRRWWVHGAGQPYGLSFSPPRLYERADGSFLVEHYSFPEGEAYYATIEEAAAALDISVSDLQR